MQNNFSILKKMNVTPGNRKSRIEEKETLLNKVQAWNIKRNASNAKAHWQFTTEDAGVKLSRLYPTISS